MTNKIKINWLKMARHTRALFVMLFVIALLVPVVVVHASADASLYDRDAAIIFDLSQGNVAFTDTTYSGYNAEGGLVSGTHLPNNIYVVEQPTSGVTHNVISVGTAKTPVTKKFEIHLRNLNIEAPKTVENHAPAVYVNTNKDTVYLILDNGTSSKMEAYAHLFKSISKPAGKDGVGEGEIVDEAERFGHAAIEKEIGTKGTLVITCEEGYNSYKQDDTGEKGHNCTQNGKCGALSAKAVGEAAFDSKKNATRTAAAAAIGSKAEVTEHSRSSLSGAPTKGILYNLTIAGGRITATGATGNYNTQKGRKIYLGGSPGIGVGAGMQQYSRGYELNALRITGGYIDAIAGDGSAANIGGGYHAGYSRVHIYGGTIFAQKQVTGTDDMKRGAGIGGGGGGATSNATNGATVYIYGGTVNATSSYGAAIGAGAGGTSGQATAATVRIYGGDVTATTTKGDDGNGAGAAIGTGGSLGSGKGGEANIEITGGTVIASSAGGADIGGGGTNSTDNGGAGGVAKIKISGGTIKAMTNGIGGGKANKGIGGNAELEITGGTIYAASVSGGSSAQSNGGTATVTITDGTIKTGSIGGGNGTVIGAAHVTISGGMLQGQVIMQGVDAENKLSSLSMSGGVIDNNGVGGSDYLFKAANGGAICVKSGTVTITGGTIKNCGKDTILGGAIYLEDGTVNVSGGSVEKCRAREGGAIYVAGGDVLVSGEGAIQGCNAISGGAIYVAGGDVVLSGGAITNNIATQNGGGIAVMDGNYYMYGGSVNANQALVGDGGGIYVSSTKANAQIDILIRSGIITTNQAGNSGGALGVHGRDDAIFTITIGLNIKHTNTAYHICDEGEENCPVIQANTSSTNGGGIYLAGSFNAQMNIYCLVESDNKAAGGVSASNFMKVEGGTLRISSQGKDGDLDHGNVVVNSSIHVTGGQVTLAGRGDNPLFTQPITVNIDASGESYFKDLREKGTDSTTVSVQYFENFKINGVLSGQYISIDVLRGTEHTVQAALFSHTGFVIEGWTLMVSDGENHVTSTPLAVYTAGAKLVPDKDIILYAKWVVAGYTIEFLPGSDDYLGEMKDQAFTYDEKKELTPNAYSSVGYVFDHWVDKATQKKYTDAQTVSELSQEHGTVITLVAVWRVCSHLDESKFILTSTDNSISCECACHGYTETVTLINVTGIYAPDKTYAVKVQRTFSSVNEYEPKLWGDESTIAQLAQYTGYKWGAPAIAFADPIPVPQHAGQYVATVTLSGISLKADVTIYKANQNPPSVPDYEIGTNDENTNKIILHKPNTNTGKVMEYSLWWYENDQLTTKRNELGEVVWLEWLDTADNNSDLQPWTLSKSFTNYFVEVRYAETDDYNPSNTVRGVKLFYQDGKVVVKVVGEDGLNVNLRESDSSGLVVDFTPQEAYYIFELRHRGTEYAINNAAVTGYSIAVSINQSNVTATINNIPDYTGDSPLTITIAFVGAEKKAMVVTDTVENQVFSDISSNGQNNVTISLDSAYTVLFKLENYANYSKPSVKFSSALPKGTRLILIDRNDLSYWSYTTIEAMEETPLSSFTRMGSQSIAYELDDSDNLKNYTLQIIVDFSDCETAPNFTELTAYLFATGNRATVPALPTDGQAVSTIFLVAAPNFSIDQGESTDDVTQTIRYNFAQIAGAGISKWDVLRGILLVAPKDGMVLPPDVRLEVKIGNATRTYALADGKFIVALSAHTGTAYMKLLSDMMPVAGATYEFDIKLYASDSMVGSAPAAPISTVASPPLKYSVAQTKSYSLSVEMVGTLPLCQKREDESLNISPLAFRGKVGELPSNYTIKASLYIQNKDGIYTSTTQTMLLTVSNHEFGDELNLSTLENQMRDNTGSLSLMLRIEIVDPNGKPVYYVPLYFVLVDIRE